MDQLVGGTGKDTLINGGVNDGPVGDSLGYTLVNRTSAPLRLSTGGTIPASGQTTFPVSDPRCSSPTLTVSTTSGPSQSVTIEFDLPDCNNGVVSASVRSGGSLSAGVSYTVITFS